MLALMASTFPKGTLTWQYARIPSRWRLRSWATLSNAGRRCQRSAHPRRQEAPGRAFVGVLPQVGQLLFEQVGFRESTVQSQEVGELLALGALEIPPRAQEQPPLA